MIAKQPLSPNGCIEPEAEVSKLRSMRAQHGLCCICEELNVMMLNKDLTFTLDGLLASFEGLYETHYVEQCGCP